jgi:hypothetical protein
MISTTPFDVTSKLRSERLCSLDCWRPCTGGAIAILGGIAACEFAVGAAEAGIRLAEQEP